MSQGLLKFRESRARQLYRQWKRYHLTNLHVWRRFDQNALAMAKVREFYSARTIISVLRFEIDSINGDSLVKINDHYSPFYARLWMEVHPEHEGFFATRRRTSESRPARGDEDEVFDSGPTGAEERWLEQEIADLARETLRG